MISRNLIIMDLETSGLDEQEQEIVQIAATAINIHDLSPHHAGSFNCYVKPEKPEKAQAGAIKILGDGWTKAQEEGLDAKVAISKFLEWCHLTNDKKGASYKSILIAHNKDFDSRFIRHAAISKNLVKKSDWGWEFPWSFEMCNMSFMFSLFESCPDVYDLKLDTALNKLKLQRKGKTHDALEDVELLAQFVVRYLKYQRECAKRMKIE